MKLLLDQRSRKVPNSKKTHITCGSGGSLKKVPFCTVWHTTSASHLTQCKMLIASPEFSCAQKENSMMNLQKCPSAWALGSCSSGEGAFLSGLCWRGSRPCCNRDSLPTLVSFTCTIMHLCQCCHRHSRILFDICTQTNGPGTLEFLCRLSEFS